METRSAQDNATVLPPVGPDLAMLQSLEGYLDASRDDISPDGLLCQVCQRMMEYWVTRTADALHIRTPTLARPFNPWPLTDMRTSANAGCHICCLLHRTLQKKEADHYKTRTLELRPPQKSGQPGTYLGSVRLGPFESSAGEGLLDVTFLTSSQRIAEDAIRSNLPRSLDYNTTASRAAFRMAILWLNECMAHHDGCTERDDQKGFTPNRLLEIRRSGHSLPDSVTVHLRGKNDIRVLAGGQRPAYVTLGHLWGDVQPLKLEKANILRFLNGVTIECLPQTYRDAVIVTATLGFTWIWIDSLCIVQDSPQDWEIESQMMGRIYGDCTLNIAALSSIGCHGGLFSQRNAQAYRDCDLSVGADQFIRVKHSNFCSLGPEINAQGSPPKLLSRGWVMQEVTLSPRTLYYCGDIIFWECRSCIACEEHPVLDSSRKWDGKSNLMGKKAFQDMLASSRASRTVDFMAWYDLVKAYSATRFTYEKDRYYAFLGLARLLQKNTGMDMVAGLWTTHLLRELTWTSDAARSRQAWLPTWSWLSLDATVILAVSNDEIVDYAEIVKHPNPDTAFSDVTYLPASARSIEMRGPLLELEVRANTDSGLRRITSEWGEMDMLFDLDLDLKHGSAMCALALFRQMIMENTCLHGLLVRPSPAEPGYWVRVGTCYIDDPHVDKVKSTEFKHISLL